VDVEDPNAPSWAEALESDDCDKWLEGANAELSSLHKMNVYELVPRHKVPTNRSILRGKFICCLKCNEMGILVCHKVRWVVRDSSRFGGETSVRLPHPQRNWNHSASSYTSRL
jgi:hypothetical protein